MNGVSPITVDIDLSGLPAPDAIIKACETEDEIGCVLRLHFLVEQVVDFYFARSVSVEAGEFVSSIWEFRHKLDRAVIVGLPIPFAYASVMLAKIRNDAAHGKSSINSGYLDNLINRVDALNSICEDFTPIHKRWLNLHSMPGQTIALKSHSIRFDFMITALALYAEMHKWVATTLMARAALAQRVS